MHLKFQDLLQVLQAEKEDSQQSGGYIHRAGHAGSYRVSGTMGQSAELRKNKRRPVKAERQGLFSGLLFCPDCGNKLHFATCKSFDGKQDHYVCSSYKSGRGTCSAHYIREDVLRELVQERIQAVNAYIRSDVEGFQEEWLHYRRADQERDIREDQKRVEQARKRLAILMWSCPGSMRITLSVRSARRGIRK